MQDFEKDNAGGDAKTGQDPLSTLEHQWEKLVKTIQDLRKENVLLREQSQEQEEYITRLKQEADAKKEEMAALSEEKRQTILRIEGLLGRFDDLGAQ